MLEMILREMTMIMAQIHSSLTRINKNIGLGFDDKDLHFIIMALLSMALFFVVHALFKWLAKWSVTAISFIYVFTMMTVLGFAIEIGQKITGTGEMHLNDVVAGLWGVLAFFLLYTVFRIVIMIVQRIIRYIKRRAE